MIGAAADSKASVREEAEKAFEALDEYLRRERYRGYEFDDLLGSPLVSRLTFDRLLLQRVAVQVGKLSPINIRPLVGVRKRESSSIFTGNGAKRALKVS